MRYSSFCAVITLALLASSVVFAQAPDSLSFQGFVISTAGAPINSPSESMTFKLYEGSSQIWSETQPSVKNVVGGAANNFVGPGVVEATIGGGGGLLFGLELAGIGGGRNKAFIINTTDSVGIGTTTPIHP